MRELFRDWAGGARAVRRRVAASTRGVVAHRCASWGASARAVGLKGRILAFEPRRGGAYRVTLSYDTPDHSAPGKSSAHEDVVEGRFVELVPNERVVQCFEFQSDDPAYAGTMTMTWALTPTSRGAPRSPSLVKTCPKAFARKTTSRGCARPWRTSPPTSSSRTGASLRRGLRGGHGAFRCVALRRELPHGRLAHYDVHPLLRARP